MSIATAIERLKDTFHENSEAAFMVGSSLMTWDHQDFDEFFAEKAEREIRETPEVKEEAFEILTDLLAGEKNLFVPNEKEFLTIFLRKCKWYPDSAFRLIKRYYDFKKRHPEIYDDLIPSKEQDILLSGVLIPLPRRTANGDRVFMVHFDYWKPREVSLIQLLRGLILFTEIAAAEIRSQVAGARVIFDAGKLNLSHVPHFSPNFASAVIDFYTRCTPVRLKGVHVVNDSFIFSMIFSVFKVFMNSKFRAKVHLHGTDRESLLKHIDAKALPKQYGGEIDLPDEPICQPVCNYANAFEEYFRECSRFGYTTKK